MINWNAGSNRCPHLFVTRSQIGAKKKRTVQGFCLEKKLSTKLTDEGLSKRPNGGISIFLAAPAESLPSGGKACFVLQEDPSAFADIKAKPCVRRGFILQAMFQFLFVVRLCTRKRWL